MRYRWPSGGPNGLLVSKPRPSPAVAVPRLSLSSTGKVIYTLKTPCRDGTTQVAFEPVDFIACIEGQDIIYRILANLRDRKPWQKFSLTEMFQKP